jgi:NADH dehydrogenase FAD-containing subunit
LITDTKKRVLILGGGFGGVYVAVHLGKFLSKKEREEIEIVLVNRENYIVFQPLLPEVIFGIGRIKSCDRSDSPHGPEGESFYPRC